MNKYLITFEDRDGVETTETGDANNIPYAIKSAKRKLARRGVDLDGLRFVSARLVSRA